MSTKTKKQIDKELIAQTPQQLSDDDRDYFQELHRTAMYWAFAAEQVKGNTALVPEGQRVAKEFEAVARLMENAKNQWIAFKLSQMGYPNEVHVKIDVKTGTITPA